MASTYEFDIFLSYKSEEAAWVDQLRQDLQNRGVRVWLDRDQIRPGNLFAQALETGLATSKAVALVVTPESVASNWVKEEYYRALSLANQGNLQLIPLLLRNAELPGFLSGRQYVDFRDAKTYEQSVNKLVWPGVTGKRILFIAMHPGHGVPWQALLKNVNNLGIDFVEGEDMYRTGLKLNRYLNNSPPTRVVIVVDIFWGIGGLHQDYVNYMFSLRERSKGTSKEIVFLLYHSSDHWDSESPKLNQEDRNRLLHYFTIDQKISGKALSKAVQDVSYRIQNDLMRVEQQVDHLPSPISWSARY
jgi:hypothetical protein